MREFADDTVRPKVQRNEFFDSYVYLLAPLLVIGSIIGLGALAAWFYHQEEGPVGEALEDTGSFTPDLEWSAFCDFYREKWSGVDAHRVANAVSFNASYFAGNSLVEIKGQTDLHGGLVLHKGGKAYDFSIDYGILGRISERSDPHPYSPAVMKSLALVFGDPLLKALESPADFDFDYVSETVGGRRLYRITTTPANSLERHVFTINANSLLLERCEVYRSDFPIMSLFFSDFQSKEGRPVPQRVLARTEEGDTYLMRVSAEALN